MRLSKDEVNKLMTNGNVRISKHSQSDLNKKPTKTASNLKRVSRSAKDSVLETIFLSQCKSVGLPMPTSEVVFHETRKWRLDFTWEEYGVALEIDGGTYTHRRKKDESGNLKQSRHLTPTGYYEDCIKLNNACLYGYAPLRADSKMVRNGEALAFVKAALVINGWEA